MRLAITRLVDLDGEGESWRTHCFKTEKFPTSACPSLTHAIHAQGSDDDVHSDDLLYESGEDDEDSGGDVLGAWDDEDD